MKLCKIYWNRASTEGRYARLLQQLQDSEINSGFVEILTDRTLDRANMGEHVLAAAIRLDEAVHYPMT